MKKRILLIALVICAVLLLPSAVFAAAIDNAADLQTALNSAADGAVIELSNGATIKLTTTLTIPKGKSITINGNGATLAPDSGFAADGHGAAIAFAFDESSYSASNNYVMKNLTFDGFSGLTRVVRANFSTTVVENCIFQNNSVTEGVITTAYGELTVKDCDFISNAVPGPSGTGVAATINVDSDVSAGNEKAATITGNSFIGNSADTAIVYLASSASVTGNYFKDNTHSGSNANGSAILAGPYTGSLTYTMNITGNGFDNAMSKDGNALPAVFAEDWSSLGSTTSFDLSSNYWDGKAPAEGTAYKTSGDSPDVAVNDYYTQYSISNGELVLSNPPGAAAAGNVQQNADVPRTGDQAQLGLWLAMSLLSCVGMLVIISQKKKERMQ